MRGKRNGTNRIARPCRRPRVATQFERQISMRISSSRLTTCSVAADGETIELGLVDRSGAPVILQLPLDQAEAVVMTLPNMLTRAVKRRTGTQEARYVFSLNEWLIEDTGDKKSLIVTLRTTDGFEVSFAIPLETCQSLGWSLKHEADGAIEAQEPADQGRVPGRSGLN